ncbi:MAG: NAD(P)-binding domain-containing protein [Gammaproteobacteria bacterium]|nr:NAD(P)-binding domain-containing protein [Gammaproteobacteria bacterium]
MVGLEMSGLQAEEIEIGIIGRGTLADLIATHLGKAGYALGGLEDESGVSNSLIAREFPSPRMLAGACPVIVTALSDGTELERVLFGDTGIAQCWRTDTLVIDMSTVSPEFLQELSEQLVENGIAFLDAVIINEDAGDPDSIQMMLVGGDANDYERALPIFEKIARSVRHLGSSGASQFYRQAFAVRKKRQ